MNDKLREYIDNLFSDAPQTRKAVEMREEIFQNITDKYNDLIAEGKSEEAAYNIAVAAIGDVTSILRETTATGFKMSESEYEAYRKRSALITAVSVSLYILSAIPLIMVRDDYGVIIALVLIAGATGMLVYNNMTKPQIANDDGTIAEEFRQWRVSSQEQRKSKGAIKGAVWALSIVLYFLISFGTNAWHVTWLIFFVALACNFIIDAIFDLKR